MKKSTVLLLLAVVAGVFLWQRTGSDVDADFLRELATDASTKCADYYAALPEYAFSDRQSKDEESLGAAMNGVKSAISSMNLAIYQEDQGYLYPEVMDVANAALRPQDYSEAQRLDFLKVTLKEECRKWQAFSQLSDREISAYFEKRNDSLTDGISHLCDAIKAETSKIPTQIEIQIMQCEVQQGTSGAVLVVGLNDWLEWIDFSDEANTPDSEGLNEYIFDFPLQLIVNGFRLINASPDEFEAVFVAFRDEKQTVYELSSTDVETAVSDTRALKTVLLELREKIKISSL